MSESGSGTRGTPAVPKILVVDDVRLFVQLERTFLRRFNCEVLDASTGEEALEVVRSERPRLVILDDQMPGIGGIEACRRVKSDPELEGTLVLMTSSPGLELECREAGADGFISKPFLQGEFVQTVRELLPELPARANARAFVHLDLDLILEDRTVRAGMRDLSITGLFVLTELPVTIGQTVRMRFSLPGGGGPLDLEGEVRNKVVPDGSTHLSPGFGVLFREIDPRARARIEAFVQSLERGEEPRAARKTD